MVTAKIDIKIENLISCKDIKNSENCAEKRADTTENEGTQNKRNISLAINFFLLFCSFFGLTNILWKLPGAA